MCVQERATVVVLEGTAKGSTVGRIYKFLASKQFLENNVVKCVQA